MNHWQPLAIARFVGKLSLATAAQQHIELPRVCGFRCDVEGSI
jgi:hypothetical protein